jgi:hypothetical protein
LIYVDTSVVLAQLLAEDRYPPDSISKEPLVSSRLLEYEVWNRIHSHGLTESHSESVHLLLNRIMFLELAPPVLVRALDPFPTPVRTLDTLHLASIEFLRSQGQQVQLASYDERLLAAARRLGIPLVRL